MTNRFLSLTALFLLWLPTTAMSQESSRQIEDVAMDIVAKNPGLLVETRWAKSLDPRAAEADFQEFDPAKFSKADVMRVLLQTTSAFSKFKPTIILFSRKGEQKLLLDPKKASEVVDEFEHGNRLAAVRMFAERVTKPTGESFKLPDGLLPRTTEAFNIADEIYAGSSQQSSGDSTKSIAGLSGRQDKWKPTQNEEHGPLVESLIKRAKSSEIKLKDGVRADWKQTDSVIDRFHELYKQALTDVKVIAQQNEQGGNQELPEGWSELLNVRVKFDELFTIANDDVLFPITESTIFYAPESSFAGIQASGKKGEPKGRVTGKYKVWHSGVSRYSSGHSYYTTHLRTDAGPLGTGWSPDAFNFKWGDIKHKIVYDRTEKKSDEDSDMQRRALSASD